MAAPDFSQRTKETLAKRARYQCSNPDCRTHTVGPNSDPEKSTSIGEAAHIYGAKPGSARFDTLMTDQSRAQITNGLWLCKNCHGQIDRDERLFPPELLLAWRRDHEERALEELGSRGEKLRYEYELSQIGFLNGYPEIIQRLALDKPEGWEWSITAELCKHLNRQEFRRLNAIQDGLCFKRYPRVDEEDFLHWLTERSYVMINLISPLDRVLQELSNSWGAPGSPGDLEEIHHACNLLHDLLKGMVDHEEELKFAQVPEEAEEIRTLLLDAIGKNLTELEILPRKLEEVVSMIETDHGGTHEDPLVLKYAIKFSLPDGFNDHLTDALERYTGLQVP